MRARQQGARHAAAARPACSHGRTGGARGARDAAATRRRPRHVCTRVTSSLSESNHPGAALHSRPRQRRAASERRCRTRGCARRRSTLAPAPRPRPQANPAAWPEPARAAARPPARRSDLRTCWKHAALVRARVRPLVHVDGSRWPRHHALVRGAGAAAPLRLPARRRRRRRSFIRTSLVLELPCLKLLRTRPRFAVRRGTPARPRGATATARPSLPCPHSHPTPTTQRVQKAAL